MKIRGILTVPLLALAVMACSTSLLASPASQVTLTPGILPTSYQPTTGQPPASPQPTVARQGKVCFAASVAAGKLRVRECPGLDCGESGFLADSDLITTTGERREADGATWLRITAPIAGWVSARYVCEK